MLWLGIISFLLFFFSDLNDLLFNKKFLALCFPAGLISLIVSVTAQALKHSSAFSIIYQIIFIILALIFLALTTYSLFFAIPITDSYANPGKKRPANTTGVYALCRHPGVLWFSLLFVCLWPAVGLPLKSAAVYILLNILLAFFEDIVIFPSLLTGYPEYRKTTPFLIPRIIVPALRKTTDYRSEE